jgi:hypothetical protein
VNERRDAVLAVVLLLSVVWAVFSWVLVPEISLWLPGLVWHRIGSVMTAAALTIYLYFALAAEPGSQRFEA